MLDPQGASYYIRVAKQMLTGSQAKFCHTKRVPQKNRKQKHEEEVTGCEPHIILDSFFSLDGNEWILHLDKFWWVFLDGSRDEMMGLMFASLLFCFCSCCKDVSE